MEWNIFKVIRGWVKLVGGTDDTIIGNLGDALKIVALSHVDTLNSRNTNLTADEVFVGEWVDVRNHQTVSVAINTSHPSATDGLVIEFSTNQSDASVVDQDKYTMPANNPKPFTAGCTAQYFRVKYTNGPDATTSFNLSTLHHPFTPKPSSHRINDAIIDEDDAELTKSVIAIRKPNGQFVNAQGTTNGNFKMSLEEADPSVRDGTKLPTLIRPLEVSGDLTGLNSTLLFSNLDGYESLGIQITGNAVGTITFQASQTNVEADFKTIDVFNGSNRKFSNTGTNDLYDVNISGLKYIRAKMTAYTSGTASLVMFGTAGTSRHAVVQVVQDAQSSGTNSRTLVTTIETGHNKIHEGKDYEGGEVIVLGNGAARRYLFTPSPTAHLIYSHLVQSGAAIRMYENPTGVTVSGSIALNNKNRNSANVTASTLQIVTGFTTLGTLIETIDTGTGNNINLPLDRNEEWDLASGKTYLIEFISNNAGNTITTKFNFYES